MQFAISLLLVASASAFHAPTASRASTTRAAIAMKDIPMKGFWNDPAWQAKQASANNPVRMPTIGEAQPTGDTAHKGAFWKRPEWQGAPSICLERCPCTAKNY